MTGLWSGVQAERPSAAHQCWLPHPPGMYSANCSPGPWGFHVQRQTRIYHTISYYAFSKYTSLMSQTVSRKEAKFLKTYQHGLTWWQVWKPYFISQHWEMTNGLIKHLGKKGPCHLERFKCYCHYSTCNFLILGWTNENFMMEQLSVHRQSRNKWTEQPIPPSLKFYGSLFSNYALSFLLIPCSVWSCFLFVVLATEPRILRVVARQALPVSHTSCPLKPF